VIAALESSEHRRQPTADIQAIAGELARYKELNGSNIEFIFVDAETAPVWGQRST
jgi:hypothetical protein